MSFRPVLERLRGNINDERWQQKIIYFHALTALGPERRESAARRELKKLGSIAEVNDVEILQLYFDLFHDEIPYAERLKLLDRMVELSRNLKDRLYARGARAVLYFSMSDLKGAEKEMAELLDEVRAEGPASELGSYERYKVAQVIDALGTMRRDPELLMEAIELFKAMGQDSPTPEGRGHILDLLGEAYKHKGEFKLALEAFENAYVLKPREVIRVFIAECHFHLRDIAAAKTAIDEASYDALEQAEQADYAYTFAAIAIELGDRERLESAKNILRTTKIPDPYFRERRDAYVLNVQEALMSGTSKGLVDRTRALFGRLTGSLLSYLVLKPSFMGIGVDVGKIIEDMSKKRALTDDTKGSVESKKPSAKAR